MGLADGIYPWDDRQIEVNQGTARLSDGTLSGTTLPLLAGVNNLLDWGIVSPESAIGLATESPRQAIALQGLSVGQEASLLRWHGDQVSQKLTFQRLS
jgi:N-acetylglucosamine-6-phosphate deacetylase